MAGNPLAQALMGAMGGGGGKLPQGPPPEEIEELGEGGGLASAVGKVNALLEEALDNGGAIDIASVGPEIERMMQLMDELTQQQKAGPPPGGPPMPPPSGGM